MPETLTFVFICRPVIDIVRLFKLFTIQFLLTSQWLQQFKCSEFSYNHHNWDGEYPIIYYMTTYRLFAFAPKSNHPHAFFTDCPYRQMKMSTLGSHSVIWTTIPKYSKGNRILGQKCICLHLVMPIPADAWWDMWGFGQLDVVFGDPQLPAEIDSEAPTHFCTDSSILVGYQLLIKSHKSYFSWSRPLHYRA